MLKSLIGTLYFLLGVGLTERLRKIVYFGEKFYFFVAIPVLLVGYVYALRVYDDLASRAEIALNIFYSGTTFVIKLFCMGDEGKAKWRRFHDEYIVDDEGGRAAAAAADDRRLIFGNARFRALLEARLKRTLKMIVSTMAAINLLWVVPIGVSYCAAPRTDLGHFSTLFTTAVYPGVDVHTGAGYAATCALHIAALAIPTAFFAAAFAMVMFFATFVQCVQRYSVEQIRGDRRLQSAADAASTARNALHRIIRIHRVTTKMVDAIISLLIPTVHMATLLVFGGVVDALILNKNMHIFHALKLMVASIISFALLVVICEIGQIIDAVNGNIQDALWRTDWYAQRLDFKKDALIFHLLLNKNRRLKVFNLKVMSRIYLAQVLRLNYSIIQVTLRIVTK